MSDQQPMSWIAEREQLVDDLNEAKAALVQVQQERDAKEETLQLTAHFVDPGPLKHELEQVQQQLQEERERVRKLELLLHAVRPHFDAEAALSETPAADELDYNKVMRAKAMNPDIDVGGSE